MIDWKKVLSKASLWEHLRTTWNSITKGDVEKNLKTTPARMQAATEANRVFGYL